jgi:hypothetical protein
MNGRKGRLGLLGALAFVFAQDTPLDTVQSSESTTQYVITTVCHDVSLDSLSRDFSLNSNIHTSLYPNASYERGGIVKKRNDGCMEIIEIEDPLRKVLYVLQTKAETKDPAVFGELAQLTAMRYHTFQSAGTDASKTEHFQNLTQVFTKASINYTGLYHSNPALYAELTSTPLSAEELQSFQWFSQQHKSGKDYETIQEEDPDKAKQAQAYMIKSTFVDAEATIQTLLKAGYNFPSSLLDSRDIAACWHTHIDEAQPYSKPDVQFSRQYHPLFTLYPVEGYNHTYINKEGHLDDVTVFPE